MSTSHMDRVVGDDQERALPLHQSKDLANRPDIGVASVRVPVLRSKHLQEAVGGANAGRRDQGGDVNASDGDKLARAFSV